MVTAPSIISLLPRALCCLALLCLVCACSKQSDRRSLIRIGTSGDYEPFSLVQEDGSLQGFDVELAKRFVADQGLELEFVPFKWPELARDFQAGKFDLAMSGITIRTDRSIAGQFSVPTTLSGAVALVSESFRVQSMEELNRPTVRVGVNEGGHLERVTRLHLPNATILVSKDNQSLPTWLNEGRIDVLITDTMEAPFWLERLTGIKALPPFTQDFKAVWLRADRSDLASKLNAWLLEEEASGRLNALRSQWLPEGNEFPTAEPLFALMVAMKERLSLMVAVAEAKQLLGRPVEDLAQEARVLEAAVEGVRREANSMGIPPPGEDAVRNFIQAQMDVAKAIQYRTLEGPATLVDPPDLAEDLRPALGRISTRINRLICTLASMNPEEVDPVNGQLQQLLSESRLAEEDMLKLETAVRGLLHPQL